MMSLLMIKILICTGFGMLKSKDDIFKTEFRRKNVLNNFKIKTNCIWLKTQLKL